MIALFLGTGALVFMFAAEQYLIGGILAVVFVVPILIWRLVYSHADKNIYKRIEKSKASLTTVAIVEKCDYLKNSKKDHSGKELYLTCVLTGEDQGDKIPYRFYTAAEKFKRGDYVLVKFLKEQYQNCLVVRKAKFNEYKAQFPPDYWNGYDGDGSDLLFEEEEQPSQSGGAEVSAVQPDCETKTAIRPSKESAEKYSFLGGTHLGSAILHNAFSFVFLVFGIWAFVFGFTNKTDGDPFFVGSMALAFAICCFIVGGLPCLMRLVKIRSVTKSGGIAEAKIENYRCKAKKGGKHSGGHIYYHSRFDFRFIDFSGKEIVSKFTDVFYDDPNLYDGKILPVLYNEKYSVLLSG
jgi:hypothetical protein